MSEDPQSIKLTPEQRKKVFRCQADYDIKFNTAIKKIIDAYKPKEELVMKIGELEEKLKKLKKELSKIEEKEDKEHQLKQNDKMIEEEKQEKEKRQRDERTIIWEEIKRKFKFKPSEREKAHKYIDDNVDNAFNRKKLKKSFDISCDDE